MRCCPVAFLLSCSVLNTYSLYPNGSFTKNAEKLVLSPEVTVTWESDKAEEFVDFEVVAKRTGWVGFGFSAQGNMVEADLVYGGIDPTGSVYFEDCWSTGNQRPTIDPMQNWIKKSIGELDGVTTLKIGRSIPTADPLYDRPLEDKNTFFIYALGVNDTFAYHGPATARGKHAVNILKNLNLPPVTDKPPMPINNARLIPATFQLLLTSTLVSIFKNYAS